MQFITVLLCFISLASANLMAVDLGTAYIKTAVARPGKGLELVLNDQAKRKTPAVVGFTEEGERLFGDAAVGYAAKKPNRVIFNARNLIGKCADGDDKPAPYCKPATVTIDGVGEFTGVHVVAMLLTMARKHAEAHLGGSAIKDVAITVPSSFHIGQRIAICDAAQVAGLSCLGVVNTNTAVAIKYALDNKAKPPAVDADAKKGRSKKAKDANLHTALFYDVGASGSSATVARFHSGLKGTVSKLEVLSHASDNSLGGSILDEFLVGLLADAFDKQRDGTPAFTEDPRKAREMPRVMARLRKEAAKAREVLSANTERLVSIGSVHQDMDLRATLTRAELETAAAPLLSGAARPVLAAIQSAGVRIDGLHAIVPFGGTTRTPKIQSVVLEALNRPSMNKSINGDEAAVMGAVYYGASLSSTFRVRKMDVFDKFQRTVSAEVGRDPSSGGLLSAAKPRSPQKVVIFDSNSMRMPAKKTISFNRKNDFEVKIFFDLDKTGSSPFSQRTVYSLVKVSGVAKVLDRLGKNPGSKKTATKPTPRVSLTFHMDPSGNIRIGTAESAIDEVIVVEREVPIKTEKKDSKDKKSAESPSVTPSTTPSDAANESPAADSKDEQKKEEKKEEKKTKIEKREQSIVHRQSLTIEYIPVEGSIRDLSMNDKELKEAKSVLKKLEEADNARLELADALNGLEGYILGARSKLRGVEEEDSLYKVSTEDERSNIIKELDEAEDWMFSDEASNTAALRKKHHELRRMVRALETRASELDERPKAVESLRKDLALAAERMRVVEKLHIERKSGNEKAFETFQEFVAAATKWLDEQVAAQEKQALTEDPLLTLKMLDDKRGEVIQEMTKLAKLELPPAPSVSAAPESETNDSTSASPSEAPASNSTEEKETEKEEGPKVGEGDGVKVEVDAPSKDEL